MIIPLWFRGLTLHFEYLPGKPDVEIAGMLTEAPSPDEIYFIDAYCGEQDITQYIDHEIVDNAEVMIKQLVREGKYA